MTVHIGDDDVPSGRLLQQVGQQGRVQEGHIAGDDQAMGVAGRREGGVDAGQRAAGQQVLYAGEAQPGQPGGSLPDQQHLLHHLGEGADDPFYQPLSADGDEGLIYPHPAAFPADQNGPAGLHRAPPQGRTDALRARAHRISPRDC
jgi:hypothetical protein